MDWPVDPNASRNILINSAGLSMCNFLEIQKRYFIPDFYRCWKWFTGSFNWFKEEIRWYITVNNLTFIEILVFDCNNVRS